MPKLNANDSVTILVEGETDKSIVGHFLSALGDEVSSRTRIIAANGKEAVRDLYKELRGQMRLVALVDADEPSVPDAEAWAREYFGTNEANVFCAVPTIEAWVFADKELALKSARDGRYAKASIGRLVTPESLINPKHLINQIYSKDVIRSHFPFLAGVNVGRAIAASASLFRFLRGVEAALEIEWTYAEQHLSEALNRKAFANLLREIPGSTIGWRTLNGEYTAEQLGDLVLQGDEVGLRYVSELLRVARDILAARANPSREGDGEGQENA